MSMSRDSVVLALAALATDRTPARIAKTLMAGGRAALAEAYDGLDAEARDAVAQEAEHLRADDIRATIFGDADFPPRLLLNGRPAAPLLFFRGNFDLFREPGVGICGSRSASHLGMEAARASAQQVVRAGGVVISGNARGVDSAAHSAALAAGGRTIFVLAEGFHHTRASTNDAVGPDCALFVSQFAPRQPWASYTAMGRNKVIVHLAKALVVVEAGDRGGSLAAGKEALKSGRPVFVCDLEESTPPGSLALISAGARRVRPEHLADVLTRCLATETEDNHQGSLF